MRFHRFFSSAGLIALAILVLVSTLAVDTIFRGVRLDLTEGKLYTLSDGSKKIVADLPEKVDLFFYFSHDATKDALPWRNYARQVQEMLHEFELASNGKVKLHVIEPEPFSEEEDQAAEYGLQAIPLAQGGDPIYFGLAAVRTAGSSGDAKAKTALHTEIIPFFQPDRRNFMEYDIAKLIYQTGRVSRPKVAVISGLDVGGGWDMMTRQPTEPWVAYQQVEQLFDVTKLDSDVEHIGNEYSLLVLIHPKDLPETLQYAIDQFALRGGHILAFVDPYAEQDRGGMFGGDASRASDLGRLLNAWGVKMDTSKVIGDYKLAVPVAVDRDSPRVKHLAILQLTEKNHASDDMMIRNLESINMTSAGFLVPMEGAKTHLAPLLVSTDAAAPLDASLLDGLEDPSILMKNFKPTGEKYVLAAQVSGEATTAFPNGIPVKETKPDEKEESKKGSGKENDAEIQAPGAKKAEDAKALSDNKGAIAENQKKTGEIHVMVVADTDVLSDRMWVQVQKFFGQSVAQPFADNGAFLTNSVDVLAGSPDLVNIRSRGRFVRPFVVLQDMQRDAEANYQEIEESLKERLEATENKLAELQNHRDDKGALLTLTPEQQDTILKFQEEKLSIRKQLRDVQHELNRNIQDLQARIRTINILAVPLLLTIFAVVFAWVRRRKMRRSIGR
ncbi:Predicted ABC-type uncharacterized transport system involved in gliding motility, auxiliary component [gamma proteobacterium HdN1]|nr:Predicted ABC-type uncharacterized transport system involved in gliding motility, auxiliary component [gamma proteobacterium HdN1]